MCHWVLWYCCPRASMRLMSEKGKDVFWDGWLIAAPAVRQWWQRWHDGGVRWTMDRKQAKWEVMRDGNGIKRWWEDIIETSVRLQEVRKYSTVHRICDLKMWSVSLSTNSLPKVMFPSYIFWFPGISGYIPRCATILMPLNGISWDVGNLMSHIRKRGQRP